jgi:hypothetical protein
VCGEHHQVFPSGHCTREYTSSSLSRHHHINIDISALVVALTVGIIINAEAALVTPNPITSRPGPIRIHPCPRDRHIEYSMPRKTRLMCDATDNLKGNLRPVLHSDFAHGDYVVHRGRTEEANSRSVHT